MNTTKELKEWIIEKMKLCPGLKSDIQELYQLCLDEIEDGGSTTHEIQLCVHDVEELISNFCN